MIIVHLTASTFYGGPERQMLGLAETLGNDYRTVFLSFSEGERCQPFLRIALERGFEARALVHDTPCFRATIRDLIDELQGCNASVLCCHGYKANILGRMAARRVGIPVVSVSRGWTGENIKVKLYECLDRINLRWMDRVVCVSEAQAQKVYRLGVKSDRVRIIHNAINLNRFALSDARYRQYLQALFRTPKRRIIGSAGRLSPEKGIQILVQAARIACQQDQGVGFVHFGDGPLRGQLEKQIATNALSDNFVLGGHRHDLDGLLPSLDIFALPSYTEGLPNVVLEAFAARVPVVATAVGGTPELVVDGENGVLVQPGDPIALAAGIMRMVYCQEKATLGERGREKVARSFTFPAQAAAYEHLFRELVPSSRSPIHPSLNEQVECSASRRHLRWAKTTSEVRTP